MDDSVRVCYHCRPTKKLQMNYLSNMQYSPSTLPDDTQNSPELPKIPTARNTEI